jgi:TRAP-type mannitol/chloroaromatic compound transport system permease small subunit
MGGLLAASEAIDRALGRIASAAGWLLVVLTGITCFDVVCRKLGVPIPFTKFQELEWHLHTGIFSFWLGFNYTINAHPRVDSYVGDLSQRRKAWIELAGCLLFALPYTAVVMYYGWPFVLDSYLVGEHSEAANGLPYRWIVKGVLFAGLALLLLAITSVLLRLSVFLFGGRSAAEAGVKLGPSVSEV